MKSKDALAYSITILLVGGSIWIAIDPHITFWLHEHTFVPGRSGALAFVGLLVLSTVVGPVTVFPIIPAVASVFGALPTAVLSIIGWIIGSAIAFFIGRYGGKPILEKLVPLEPLYRYEKYIPDKIEFWLLVLVRTILPVDMSSYLIAVLTRVKFIPYILSTAIGVAPFSFIWAFAGEALRARNVPLIAFLAAASTLLLAVAFFAIRRKIVNQEK